MNTVRGALGTMRAEWRAAAFQFVGLPVLASLFVVWLWIKEATWWELALQVVVAAFLCFATVWLQAATMKRYRSAEPRPHWVPVFVWCAVLAVLWYWVASWSDLFAKLAPYLYSKLSHGMREPVELKNIGAFFTFIQAAVFWWVLPTVMLPFGVEWADFGLRRTQYRRIARVQGSLHYWTLTVIPAVIAAWLPELLINWKPGKSLVVEMTSTILRLGIAYGIALACWLFAIALAACSMKNQQSTVSSVAEDIGGNPTVQPA